MIKIKVKTPLGFQEHEFTSNSKALSFLSKFVRDKRKTDAYPAIPTTVIIENQKKDATKDIPK